MNKINNLIYYAAILFLAIASYVFYHSYFLLLIIIVLSVAFVVTFLLFGLSYKRVKVSIDTEGSFVHKNEDATFWVSIKNKSPLPMISADIELEIYNSYINEKENYTINCSVPGFATKKVGVVVVPKYCGVVRAEVKKIVLRDMLNIIGAKFNQQASVEVQVMPEDILIENSFNSQGIGEADFEMDKKALDGYDIIDVKLYAPGDRLQRIHWKLSIKKDELLVKEMADTLDNKLVVICELYKGSPKVLDKLIDTIYSIALKLIKEGDSFFVCFRGDGVEQMQRFEISCESELMQLISEIFLTYPSEVIDNAYQGYVKQFNSLGGIIYIAPAEAEKNISGEVLFRCGDEVVVMSA